MSTARATKATDPITIPAIAPPFKPLEDEEPPLDLVEVDGGLVGAPGRAVGAGAVGLEPFLVGAKVGTGVGFGLG